MERMRSPHRLGILIAALVIVAGCSRSPLAPEDVSTTGAGFGTSNAAPPARPSTGGSVPLLMVTSDGTPRYTTSAAANSSTPQRSTSATTVGARGNTLRLGRFTLVLPAGAFRGTATVSLSIPDTTLLECDLNITPASANRFSVPAKLTVDLTGLGVTGSQTSIYWYDPTRARWVNMAAQSASTPTTVTALLPHFSRYAAGKAGW